MRLASKDDPMSQFRAGFVTRPACEQSGGPARTPPPTVLTSLGPRVPLQCVIRPDRVAVTRRWVATQAHLHVLVVPIFLR